MTDDDLDCLTDKERLIYDMRSICLPMSQIAAAVEESIWTVENILSEAIRKVELRRTINAQDRRISWP